MHMYKSNLDELKLKRVISITKSISIFKNKWLTHSFTVKTQNPLNYSKHKAEIR